MELETLKHLRELKEEIKKRVEEEVGELEEPVQFEAAKADFPGETRKLEQMHTKISTAEGSLEKAEKILEKIDTDEIRELRDQMDEKSQETYHENEEEHEKADKAYKALENALKLLNSEPKEHPLTLRESEIESEDNEEITKLLHAARKMYEASRRLRKKDMPHIDEEGDAKLEKLAEEIDKEREELLRKAQDIEAYLTIARQEIR
ncbi:MAG: hypothetical protein ABEJ87_02550 [Candidatus Nanohalobium sp.]